MIRQKPRRNEDRHRSPKTSWESVSDWYASYLGQSGTLQSDVLFPKTLALLKPEREKRYLDIACGEGSFSRLLAKEGIARVAGIDAAPSLIALAKQRAPANAQYTVENASKFAHLFPEHSFDGATCILAIQNIDPLDGVFAQTARLLKPGAPFVIVMNHPCFREPRQSGWGWDAERKLQYRRVDRYLSSYEMPIIAHPGSAPHLKTFSFHRPLSHYVNALAKHGFVVETMQEWISNKKSDSGPKARAENIARNEIPLFLALRARRV